MLWWGGEARVRLLMREFLMSNRGIGCCRLFNYGIGIHLLQAEDKDVDAHPPKSEINPRDDHISFQARHLHHNLHRTIHITFFTAHGNSVVGRKNHVVLIVVGLHTMIINIQEGREGGCLIKLSFLCMIQFGLPRMWRFGVVSDDREIWWKAIPTAAAVGYSSDFIMGCHGWPWNLGILHSEYDMGCHGWPWALRISHPEQCEGHGLALLALKSGYLALWILSSVAIPDHEILVSRIQRVQWDEYGSPSLNMQSGWVIYLAFRVQCEAYYGLP